MPDTSKLSQLGSNAKVATTPESSVLELISLTEADKVIRLSCCRFSCPEFTSLCPVTGQPDFAHIFIDYIPDQYLVESKSLKLFLQSFRNHGAFHEKCTCYIFDRLFTELKPMWMRVTGIWFPRGGIPIDVFVQSGQQPQNYCIPPLITSDYKGR